MSTENKEKRFIAGSRSEFFNGLQGPSVFYPLKQHIVRENLTIVEQENRLILRARDATGGYYSGDDFTMYVGKPYKGTVGDS
jgi:hypothetical protein